MCPPQATLEMRKKEIREHEEYNKLFIARILHFNYICLSEAYI